MKNLKEKLIAVDNGRFADILNCLNIKDICGECHSFMPILPELNAYRCKIMPFCIAQTLHPHMQSYLLWKIGVIDKETHYKNIGIVEVKIERIVGELKI